MWPLQMFLYRTKCYLCRCMCVCMYVCVYVCMYVCMRISDTILPLQMLWGRIWLCMYVCVYVCMRVCIYLTPSCPCRCSEAADMILATVVTVRIWTRCDIHVYVYITCCVVYFFVVCVEEAVSSKTAPSGSALANLRSKTTGIFYFKHLCSCRVEILSRRHGSRTCMCGRYVTLIAWKKSQQ